MAGRQAAEAAEMAVTEVELGSTSVATMAVLAFLSLIRAILLR